MAIRKILQIYRVSLACLEEVVEVTKIVDVPGSAIATTADGGSSYQTKHAAGIHDLNTGDSPDWGLTTDPSFVSSVP